MATHSSILAWRIPWTRAWWAMVHGVTKSDATEQLTLSLFFFWKLLVAVYVYGHCRVGCLVSSSVPITLLASGMLKIK